ncbi:MAG: Bug family tripartite tricarboxylate transporter substrate binding protein [Paracraurococcus sp.]
MHRRSLLALGAATLVRPAYAQAWPAERSIRYVVPVAPGGSQDIVARLFARHLTDALGQNVLVENLPGAGSNIGYEHVSRAKPDGYTLLAGSDSLSINRTLFPKLGFDTTGFAPVAQGVRVPQIMVVRADYPVRSFAEFVDAARAGPVAVGTPGNGSLAHLLGEQIQGATETRWTHVPYRGGALAVNDLLGGSLQGVLINIGAVTDHVKVGRLRGLFVSSGQRTPALPEVPTLTEVGLPGAVAVGWHGIVAPAGTDPAILARVNAALAEVLRRPDVAERVAALGLDPVFAPPEALGQVIQADATRWAEVIRRARIQPD